jgi:hypothetical protein
MARPLLLAPFGPVMDALEGHVHALLSPWVNALDDLDIDLGEDDL